MRCWNSSYSPAARKPYNSRASSRTLRWVKRVTVVPTASFWRVEAGMKTR
jgi:hypothetical protein